MVCPNCRKAADARAPREAHCADPGCTCGHRTEDYGTVTERIAEATGQEPDTP